MDMIPLIWPWARRVSHTNSRMNKAPYMSQGMSVAQGLELVVTSFRLGMFSWYSLQGRVVLVDIRALVEYSCPDLVV